MKKKRQQTIAALIGAHRIETQEELAERLREAGFAVTQATVSRDIRQMHLQKRAGREGKAYYSLPDQDTPLPEAYCRTLREGVLFVDTAMNLLVLKTRPGMAMAVAVAVDALELPEIVGTIAGDDTVMSAVRSVEDAQALKKRFRETICS